MRPTSAFLSELPLLYAYLVAINIAALFCYGLDKLFARSHSHRLSERALLIIALAGGSLGALIGMKIFRHKTRKNSFLILLGIILLVQLAVFLISVKAPVQLLTPSISSATLR